MSKSAVDLKKKMVDYKGGACALCGYSKCLGALHFHHMDGDEKEFNLSDSLGRSWKVIEEELDKCLLVCANCHAEIHSSAEYWR